MGTRVAFSSRVLLLACSLASLVCACPGHADTAAGSGSGSTKANSPLEGFNVHKARWQNSDACGVNCLFVMLRAHGCSVSHTDLFASTPIGAKGVSLQALKEVAWANGVPAEAVFAKPGALDVIPLPAIAHIGEGYRDHYVVIKSVDDEYVTVIDGTFGDVPKVKRGQFLRQWSGHLLIVEQPWWSRHLPIIVSGANVALLAGLGISIGCCFRRRSKPYAEASMSTGGPEHGADGKARS